MRRVLQWIEFGALAYVAIFTMIMAILTVVGVIGILPERTSITLLIGLIVFMVAVAIVFVLEAWRRFPLRHNQVPDDTGTFANCRWFRQLGWTFLGLLLPAGVVLALVLVARRLPSDVTGYQAFFTFFAAVGGWITGIAIAVFAYHQWRLRRVEHDLRYKPKIMLTSGANPATGPATIESLSYPYRIEWVVLVENRSQLPVVVNHMNVSVRLAGEDAGTDALLTPLYCHVLKPMNMWLPLQVTLSTPLHVRWIVEGPNAGDAFKHVSGDRGARDFQLVCSIFTTVPEDTGSPVVTEVASDQFYVPKDAPWGASAFFLI